MLELACTNEQKIRVSVSPVTAGGQPANVDGPIRVEVISGPGSVQMDGDRAFYVVSQDVVDADPELNKTVYLVAADADLGAGVREISDNVMLSVTSAEAAFVGLSAGAPEPK